MTESRLVDALKKEREITITVVGRKSGRRISLPVWFIVEERRLLLVPLQGHETNWYRNLRKKPSITVSAGGAVLTAKPRLSMEASRAAEIVERIRTKYGVDDIKSYYPKPDAYVEIPLS